MTESTTPAVSIKGVTKRFGRTLALDGLSFDIPDQDLFAILGPNGAGKSTLIHILCALLKADEGEISVYGTDVGKRPRQVREQLGVVFQEPSLDTRLTVEENLDFHGRVFNVPAKLRKQRINDLLELVELGTFRDRLVRTLSAGMKRRVEIARALIHNSRVVILDEPTVGLDAQSRTMMWDYLRRLRDERKITLVVTTHYIEEIENCDTVAIIDHGKLLALNSPVALKAAHGDNTVRIKASDARTFEAIRARYPDSIRTSEEELIIVNSDPSVGEGLLREFGQNLKTVSFDTSSLESVYLELTGKAVRDRTQNPVTEGGPGGQEPRM